MSYGVNFWRLFNGGKSVDETAQSWLYDKTDNGTWDADDQYAFDLLYGTKYGKQYLDYMLDKRNRKDYMKNTGLDYGDTNDPRKWPGAGSNGQMFGATLNYVSDNVKRLYK